MLGVGGSRQAQTQSENVEVFPVKNGTALNVEGAMKMAAKLISAKSFSDLVTLKLKHAALLIQPFYVLICKSIEKVFYFVFAKYCIQKPKPLPF